MEELDITLDTGELALVGLPSALHYYLEAQTKTGVNDFVERLAEYAERHGPYKEILDAFAVWANSQGMSQMALYQWLQDRDCSLNAIDPRELRSDYRSLFVSYTSIENRDRLTDEVDLFTLDFDEEERAVLWHPDALAAYVQSLDEELMLDFVNRLADQIHWLQNKLNSLTLKTED
ncbi:hypothetical protein [Roseofilum casamattae]|uniref:Uncharacterized protein n=1 Tax=Roseofilum casamattae BLCC-M143 TaxID=3022442 RepID=A0ABT7C1D4_9CYAN|nr:hypothetical protein [Roseofilum casamattae]MDJ1185261.1 hypothetical protein [Roseofilum casamattae BLCC-M143]